MPHAAGRESERAKVAPPLLVSDLHYSQWKTVPEKALTISGADRFTRRGDACRLQAIFMNQLYINWGNQEELSSAAACPRTQSIYITHGVSPWAADRTITGAKGKLYLRPASQLFSFSDHSGLMVASPGESLPTARRGAYHDALRQDSPSRGCT